MRGDQISSLDIAHLLVSTAPTILCVHCLVQLLFKRMFRSYYFRCNNKWLLWYTFLKKYIFTKCFKIHENKKNGHVLKDPVSKVATLL